jgi:glycosyltransferase involved in cell wall biosynthesis
MRTGGTGSSACGHAAREVRTESSKLRTASRRCKRKLIFIDEATMQPSLSVITAATGHVRLGRCLASVQAQTYEALEHLVVIDGPERLEAVRTVVEALDPLRHRIEIVQLPYATGKNRWNGHRIYAAFSFLSNSDFVAFLDEDNWLEPNHFQALMAAVALQQAAWGFALRKICHQDGRFIAYDQCESLGHLHTVFYDRQERLVDTNCYLIRRDVAIRFAPLWNRQARPPGGLKPADRALCQALLENYPDPACSGVFTVNYAVGNRPDSVTGAFFVEGNRRMRARYPNGLPWSAPQEDLHPIDEQRSSG